MQPILVPTDFSATATKALNYAVCVAKKTAAEIVLVHACELMHNPFQDRKELIAAYNDSIQKAALEQLEMMRKRIVETEAICISIHLYDGGVIDSILEAARTSKAGLIVMGTLGRSGLRNKILGSRTAEVIGESEVPVLTIPYGYEYVEPKRIVIALNNPGECIDLLQPVFDIAERFQADVRAAVFSAERAEAVAVMAHSRTIGRMQDPLQKKYHQTFVKTVHLGGLDFEDALQDYIASNNINLLAMVTHKQHNIFTRSMTRKMGYHTTIPLLSIRASP